MRPSRDPSFAKYRDDPDYTWIGGRWRSNVTLDNERQGRARLRANLTPEQREAERARLRARSANGSKYGLTPEQATAIDLRAGGACETCGSVARLNWDHDHETGEVRGRLCHGCNIALGALGDGRTLPDDADILDTRGRLLALIRYLDRIEARR